MENGSRMALKPSSLMRRTMFTKSAAQHEIAGLYVLSLIQGLATCSAHDRGVCRRKQQNHGVQALTQ
jgi:hypothetical protein